MIPWLIAGAILGLAAGLSPGPMTALVIGQTLQFGRSEGFKVAIAPVLTDGPLLVLTAWLAHRLTGADTILGLISLAGAGFLTLLAVESFRAEPPNPTVEAGSLKKALLTNVLNPHPYVFWITVGGPTVAASWAEGPQASVAFCAGFFACLCGSKAVLASLVAAFSAHVVGRPYRWVMRGLGVAMFAFAGAFLYDAWQRLV
ncbi:MAG: LysE family translocator [Proteobacteria bacterium]|nr:LysE family translocator [Pseudomonadota bacterium]